jgi:NADH-quinone oxidoreductase subunit H
VLLGKVALVIGLIIQLRWTLPRFRFDQLMGVAWKGLIPLGMLNLVGLAVVLTLDLSKWWLAAYSLFIVLLVGIANVTSNRRSSLSTSRSQTVTEMRAAPYEGA